MNACNSGLIKTLAALCAELNLNENLTKESPIILKYHDRKIKQESNIVPIKWAKDNKHSTKVKKFSVKENEEFFKEQDSYTLKFEQ